MTQIHSLRMIANSVRFLNNIVFRWRSFTTCQRKEKGSFWMNITSFATRLCPSDITESTTYLTPRSLNRKNVITLFCETFAIWLYQCYNKSWCNAIAVSMEGCCRVAMCRSTEHQSPSLLQNAKPSGSLIVKLINYDLNIYTKYTNDLNYSLQI